MTAPNAYELRAREEKCTKLAQYLAEEFLRVVATLEDEFWEATAARAGVNKPSEESKLRVLEILKGRLK